MIRIKLTERQGKVETLLAEGHAGYAEMGQDLVCAGVSCITIGTNNALDELAPGTFQTETREGYLKIRILNLDDPTAQLILRTAWIQLQTIAESYPEFIKLKKQEV